MSNDNEIYPLPEYKVMSAMARAHTNNEERRSVNQRLAPIYKALLDDPDGWEGELTSYVDWRDAHPTQIIPITHGQCDQFRLVRKKPKTITVEIENIDNVQREGRVVHVVCEDDESACITLNQIRKAMEGK